MIPEKSFYGYHKGESPSLRRVVALSLVPVIAILLALFVLALLFLIVIP